jgi:hypothetical protein
MAKLEGDKILGPTMYGEVQMTRRTKGIQFSNGGTGFNLNFNEMPVGLDIGMNDGPDEKRISDLKPFGPILK